MRGRTEHREPFEWLEKGKLWRWQGTGARPRFTTGLVVGLGLLVARCMNRPAKRGGTTQNVCQVFLERHGNLALFSNHTFLLFLTIVSSLVLCTFCDRRTLVLSA